MRIPEPSPVPAASESIMPMEEPCSIATAVSIVGEKWTLLMLRETLSSATRFDEFLRHTRYSSAIPLLRLRTLVTYDTLCHVPYRELGSRVCDVYWLTQAGTDLLSIIVTLMQQGGRYPTPDGKGPMLLRDRESGTPIRVTLVNTLGEPVAPENLMHGHNPRYKWGENHAATTTDMPSANG